MWLTSLLGYAIGWHPRMAVLRVIRESTTSKVGLFDRDIYQYRCVHLLGDSQETDEHLRRSWPHYHVLKGFRRNGLGSDISRTEYGDDRCDPGKAHVCTRVRPSLGVTNRLSGRRLSKRDAHHHTNLRLQTVARVVIESSAVAWFGVLLYFVLIVPVAFMRPSVRLSLRRIALLLMFELQPDALEYAAEIVFAALPMLFVRVPSE
jgi:hypothetical protein